MATCIPQVDGLSTDPRVWGVTHVNSDVAACIVHLHFAMNFSRS